MQSVYFEVLTSSPRCRVAALPCVFFKNLLQPNLSVEFLFDIILMDYGFSFFFKICFFSCILIGWLVSEYDEGDKLDGGQAEAH